MLCDNCNKNEASIHYTEVVNGVRSEHHLCSDCAARMGITSIGDIGNSDIPFVKFLTGLLASSGLGSEDYDNPMSHVRCPKCDMSYQEFIQMGKFGCSECYDVFGPLLDDNLKKLHGSAEHKGKIYAKAVSDDIEDLTDANNTSDKADDANGENISKLNKINQLNRRLKEAIELERYEDAAKYRDEIKALKEGCAND